MSHDERVDGPKIAANILNKMSARNKERIVNRIQAKNPAIAAKINNRLFDFNDIMELAPQGVQVLIKEIDPSDLTLSMKTASPEVKEYLLDNMSARKRSLVVEELDSLPPIRLNEVEAAQRRVLQTLDDLRTAGLVRSREESEIWV
ncbi:MAG: hypothetical protein KDD53_12815 [Bdellovibrionales bacterium]|nr:hypothetical protein [Bdellovibrionales bacterium]